MSDTDYLLEEFHEAGIYTEAEALKNDQDAIEARLRAESKRGWWLSKTRPKMLKDPWRPTSRFYDRMTLGLVVLTAQLFSVSYAYSYGLDQMTDETYRALDSSQYATVLLKQCTMTAERALNAVYAEDAMLSQMIANLPPIRLSDAASEVVK